MGWFDEQIKQRIKNDDEAFMDAFADMAGVVMGKSAIAAALNDDARLTRDAIEEILRFYHVKPKEMPENIKDMNDQLEFLLRPAGIMRRNVKLQKGWHKDGIGAMLGTRSDDGSVVAIVPKGMTGYEFYDSKTGKRVRVNAKNEKLIDEDALCFYKPLPLKKLGMRDLLVYIFNTLSLADFMMVALATLGVALIGLFIPRINNMIFSTVLESGQTSMLAAVAALFVSVTISSAMIGATKTVIMARLETKMNISVQAASMMRLMSLPASFFKGYGSGELSNRVQYINSLCGMLSDAILSTGFTSLFSLMYVGQIFAYAPALVAPAMLVILATVVFSMLSVFTQMKLSQKQMDVSAKESGLIYALISGVQKIKLSGAEKRAFSRWASVYRKNAGYSYDPPLIVKLNAVISTAISLFGTLALYYAAVKAQVGIADYYAFNAAYGMVSGAFLSLTGVALTIAQIKPVFNMVKPILEAVPEIAEGKQVVTRLSGGVELNNVSFRYKDDMPLIIDNLSLKIRPGQYIAIVGSTGCGKSTLMRLILGFETPQKGAVYYDGKDLNALDLKSLRRNIGVVMQNGKLFQGDVFSNITISAPWLTLEQAWEAAEKAGIADDIRRMPMQMHTIISEGGGGISGGQRQRLMIARAIAPKPRLLMFDEATSALDNITQKIVSQSLDSLKCTRIVIAHRLSTIRQCDRIIVLDKGKIVEDGNYEKLIQQNGFFAELVARQRLDAEPAKSA